MRYALEVREVKDPPEISSPKDIAKLLSDFRSIPREVLIVVHLAPDLTARFIQIAAIGSTQQCCFETSDVFREALIRETKAIIMAHNHPWERKLRPTDDDVELTEDIFEVGRRAKMPLLDHVILGPRDYYSFRENGNILSRRAYYVMDLEGKRARKTARRSKYQILQMLSKVNSGFTIR